LTIADLPGACLSSLYIGGVVCRHAGKASMREYQLRMLPYASHGNLAASA